MKNKISLIALSISLGLLSSRESLAAERQASFAVTAQQLQALDIRTMVLQQGANPVVLSLPAQVVAPTNSEQIVSSPVAGLATKIYVEPNQPVKRGAPLLRIVSPEFGNMQLALIQAQSRAKLARVAAKREQALFDEGIIAQRRVQEAQAALSESEATLRNAKATLALMGFSSAEIERVAASAKLEDGLNLRAQQAGSVIGIDVKLGQRVEPSTSLVRLAQTERLALEIQAPAADTGTWRAGSKLSLQGRSGTATVTSVSTTVSPGSQTVIVRAKLDSNAVGLRPGEFITAQLPLVGDKNGWDVPLAAVAHDGQSSYVFVRTVHGFDARKVTVVSSAGQNVRVTGSLKGGEKIAVSGVVALKGSWLGEKGGD